MSEDINAFKEQFKDFTREDIIEGLYYFNDVSGIFEYCKEKALNKLIDKENQLRISAKKL